MLTDQEKIRKAEEIYYRRNGIQYRGEKRESPKHTFRNILLILVIVGLFYGYENREMLKSSEFQTQVKTFLNTKINIKEIFSAPIQDKKENTIPEESKSDSSSEQTVEAIAPVVPEQLPEQTPEITPETVSDEPIAKYQVIWPYNGEITSQFGERESEDVRVAGNHTGIDIAGNEGDKIISAITGTVTLVSEEGNLGKHIKIENNELATVYAHCSNIYVSEGQQIEQGQEIGEVGSTGNSTGNHLHFEVIKSGEYINPLNIIEEKV